MFKKFLIIMLALQSVTAYAGVPYLGLGLGINSNLIKSTSPTANINKMGARGALLNAFAGYGDTVGSSIYLGGEFFANTTSTTAQFTNSSGQKVSSRISFGASVTPGLILTEHTMAYVKLGIVESGFKAQTTAISHAKSKNIPGAQVGMGMQTRLTDNVDLRAEYVYTGYRSFNNGGSKFSPSSDQVNLSLVFKFD